LTFPVAGNQEVLIDRSAPVAGSLRHHKARLLLRIWGRPAAKIASDAWAYNSLTQKGYWHLPVPIRGDPAFAEDYLPMVHLVFANLKSWLLGCHHGVSPQHLQAYLNEYAFRFYPFNLFRSLLGIRGHALGPTYEGLYSGTWEHPRCSRSLVA
jgi:hypothetical protein